MTLLYVCLAAFSFLLCASFVKILLPRLERMAQQPIYSDGPKWHMKKSGTPTMGGSAFVISLSLFLFLLFLIGNKLFSKEELKILIINSFFVLLHGAIGIYDDFKKIKQKKNEGLTPQEKLFYQTILCILYLFARTKLTSLKTSLTLFGKEFPLGFFYYPIVLFIMVGIINCANLTDGIDGLATSTGFTIGWILFLFSWKTSVSASVFSLILTGITLGFFLFNKHPAKIFMGDSGSLFLGAMSICIVFSLQNPFLILLVGGVYVIEGVSVVLQVFYYKKTKKRLFRMAPIHHHLELSGLSENKICLLGIFTTLLLSIVAFIIQ